MKTQIIIILIFLIYDALSAQEIISVSGDFFENENISVSQTVGEPVIETLSTGNNILTQGFQQSNLIVTGLNNFSENIKVQIYPNPTTEFINVSIETYNNVFYKLYDVDGKLLQTMKIYKPETKISFKHFSKGVYFLYLFIEDKLYGNYKIIKV